MHCLDYQYDCADIFSTCMRAVARLYLQVKSAYDRDVFFVLVQSGAASVRRSGTGRRNRRPALRCSSLGHSPILTVFSSYSDRQSASLVQHM
jgi:hypothetical protein